MRKTLLKNFRILDRTGEFFGSLLVENGVIAKVMKDSGDTLAADIIIDGKHFGESSVLMPAFIDLHAHFRDPGVSGSEQVESASLAAVSGGFTTVICMANTTPVLDSLEKVLELKTRSDALGLIDLYPVMALTHNMEGEKLSDIKNLPDHFGSTLIGKQNPPLLMLSEDGKDIASESLFFDAMIEAKRLELPVSCHCDSGGAEDTAVERVIELGKKAGCHLHIAHVSTEKSVEVIRRLKQSGGNGFKLTCEATPHHIGATIADAQRMGDKSFGRVNPPLATEADRTAIIAALTDGTIDAIATDHAPHPMDAKENGAPGFSGLETAFAVCRSHLQHITLSRFSELASANPANILGLCDRGTITEGFRSDLVIADTNAVWKVQPEKFKSRGKCTPFAGQEVQGKIMMTMSDGNIVFQENNHA